MHTIARIARFHLEIESIHPFIDGTGRTGILLMSLELIQNGYPSIDMKFFDRKRYYAASDAIYCGGNADPMITLIGEYVSGRLEKYLKLPPDNQDDDLK